MHNTKLTTISRCEQRSSLYYQEFMSKAPPFIIRSSWCKCISLKDSGNGKSYSPEWNLRKVIKIETKLKNSTIGVLCESERPRLALICSILARFSFLRRFFPSPLIIATASPISRDLDPSLAFIEWTKSREQIKEGTHLFNAKHLKLFYFWACMCVCIRWN